MTSATEYFIKKYGRKPRSDMDKFAEQFAHEYAWHVIDEMRRKEKEQMESEH